MKLIAGVLTHTKTGTGHNITLSLRQVPDDSELSITVIEPRARPIAIQYERAGQEIECLFSVPAHCVLRMSAMGSKTPYCIYEFDAMRVRKMYSHSVAIDVCRTIASIAPAPGKLFTLGYMEPEADERIHELIQAHCIIADVRIKPDSQLPRWNRKALVSALGVHYAWIQECGNENYKTPGNIKLVNGHAGANIIADYLRAGYDVCLLCKCLSPVTCHRRTVANLIKEKVPALEVIHL